MDNLCKQPLKFLVKKKQKTKYESREATYGLVLELTIKDVSFVSFDD